STDCLDCCDREGRATRFVKPCCERPGPARTACVFSSSSSQRKNALACGPMSKPLKLGIAGLGTVGSGLLQLLAEHGPRLAQSLGRTIEVAGVSARTRAKQRGVSL